MSKYSSPYFNKERYYDPTAGEALKSIIRQERNQIESVISDISISNKEPAVFARLFSRGYGNAFGPRVNGKPKNFAQYDIVRNHLRIYQYCIDHVKDKDFTIEKAVSVLNLGTDTKIKQVFSGNGQMGKLIKSYKKWLETDVVTWEKNGGVIVL